MVYKYLVEVQSVGVSDKHLSEILCRHQLHYPPHPLGIQFVEDVVEQQHRLSIGCLLA